MHEPLSASHPRSQAAEIYARAAAVHDRTASRLRANGRDDAAAMIERFAAATRDQIEHPSATARMYALAGRVRRVARLSDVFDEALDGAIEFLHADFGTVQLADPDATALRIVAQRGFGWAFLAHFAVVDDAHAACGRAAAARAQAVVVDVRADPAFAPHRAIATASGFRAVQSTPLIDRSGRLRGVLSTHFRRPERPAPHELRLIEVYARIVADAIGRALGDA